MSHRKALHPALVRFIVLMTGVKCLPPVCWGHIVDISPNGKAISFYSPSSRMGIDTEDWKLVLAS
jgi:hypothetical protein